MTASRKTIMLCQRCFNVEEVCYRAHSDIMDIIVCPTCAEEARNLEIMVEDVELGPSISIVRLDDSPTQGFVFSGTPPRRRRSNNLKLTTPINDQPTRMRK